MISTSWLSRTRKRICKKQKDYARQRQAKTRQPGSTACKSPSHIYHDPTSITTLVEYYYSFPSHLGISPVCPFFQSLLRQRRNYRSKMEEPMGLPAPALLHGNSKYGWLQPIRKLGLGQILVCLTGYKRKPWRVQTNLTGRLRAKPFSLYGVPPVVFLFSVESQDPCWQPRK